MIRLRFAILLTTLLPTLALRAQDDSTPGVRRALVICGLPGDAEHRKLFGDSLNLLYTGLVERQGFAAESVHVLWGDEPTDKDPPAVRASRGIANRETIEQAAQSLREALQPADTLWVIVLGHAHYDGRYSWLNVAGPDLNHVEFGRLFEKLACREQVFVVTTAASGFYLKSLASAGRVVIAATEADREVNETIFPHKLAAALGAPPAEVQWDIDKDGKASLLDIYLWTARQVAEEYVTGELLATEHSLLEDNGDGRGTELQLDYLPENLGGKLRPGQDLPARPKTDGLLAGRVLLSGYPAPSESAPKADEKPD